MASRLVKRDFLKEGLAPLLNTQLFSESKREASPLLHILPPPFVREGDKRGRVT
jgi:hypothetical protein